MHQKDLLSPHIKQALSILESAKGHPLSSEQRKTLSIELALCILKEARMIETPQEKKLQKQLARMMHDPSGKAFTTSMMDQCFRSSNKMRIADQLLFLLKGYGVPKYLSWYKKLGFYLFGKMGRTLLALCIPIISIIIRRETASLIIPGKTRPLLKHIRKRTEEGVRVNLNHLGEAILAEDEAVKRLNAYLSDLERPEIEYVSVKTSAIFSQIHLLGWDKTCSQIAERVRQLYRAAMKNLYTRKDGTRGHKFVNLDMEEYRDLILTKEIFMKVLNEKEFHTLSAGIVLQAYIPDSFIIQQELTSWARQRIKNGGAPIKIRIVKGANLAMEQVEASYRGWHQAPYGSKLEVDANYKRMISYGFIPENAKATHIGVATHNLFDIAHALILSGENKVEWEISFEMLEGMADHIRRAVQKLVGEILLYCPVVTKQDFHAAVSYLFRRFDENTGPENFLKHLFSLSPDSKEWEEQADFFAKGCDLIEKVDSVPRRTQNRLEEQKPLSLIDPFENEADTDFSLPQNREWAGQIAAAWHHKKHPDIPLVIGGKEIHEPTPRGHGFDPSYPKEVLYNYSMANWTQIDHALTVAKTSEAGWRENFQRPEMLSKAAQRMRERRGDFIGVMMADGAKTILEGDPEVSEAIDFAEYYARTMLKMQLCKDVQWTAKGTVLVTPPWNFPVSIPAGGILAALVAGNCVIFKPAPEAVLSGWVLVNALWDAGIPKEVLQFINCIDETEGSRLIKDPRISKVILTGATSTAKLFQHLRPGLDLSAETGGKNALIITALADRDLAIKDLIQSAFGHSGQKCSATSLAILEEEVYDDKHFRKHLKEAVLSLKVGTPWDLSSKVTPIIRAPSKESLLLGLTELHKGEEWLVKPKQDPHNPNLWSPGVKLGVRKGSFMHQTELFGPVLGIMRAKNLSDAVNLANDTRYGLTAGIHSLDEREIEYWMEHIEAGNCYVNRGITGAIVRRQPFGGTKASSFGRGAKAGGPNYLSQMAYPKQVDLPHEKDTAPENINALNKLLRHLSLSAEELGMWLASIESYAYHAKRFSKPHDPSLILGEDNLFYYKPHKKVVFRIQEEDNPLDVYRVFAAALSVNCPLEISCSKGNPEWPFSFIDEDYSGFENRVKDGACKRIRLISPPPYDLQIAASESFSYIDCAPVLANGRFELLHYLREVSFSITYHRYGNLGLREGEKRK